MNHTHFSSHLGSICPSLSLAFFLSPLTIFTWRVIYYGFSLNSCWPLTPAWVFSILADVMEPPSLPGSCSAVGLPHMGYRTFSLSNSLVSCHLWHSSYRGGSQPMALGPQRPWVRAPVSDRVLKCPQCSLPCAEGRPIIPEELCSHTANKSNSGLACGARRGMRPDLGCRYKTGEGVFTSSLSLTKYREVLLGQSLAGSLYHTLVYTTILSPVGKLVLSRSMDYYTAIHTSLVCCD